MTPHVYLLSLPLCCQLLPCLSPLAGLDPGVLDTQLLLSLSLGRCPWTSGARLTSFQSLGSRFRRGSSRNRKNSLTPGLMIMAGRVGFDRIRSICLYLRLLLFGFIIRLTIRYYRPMSITWRLWGHGNIWCCICGSWSSIQAPCSPKILSEIFVYNITCYVVYNFDDN